METLCALAAEIQPALSKDTILASKQAFPIAGFESRVNSVKAFSGSISRVFPYQILDYLTACCNHLILARPVNGGGAQAPREVVCFIRRPDMIIRSRKMKRLLLVGLTVTSHMGPRKGDIEIRLCADGSFLRNKAAVQNTSLRVADSLSLSPLTHLGFPESLNMSGTYSSLTEDHRHDF